MTPDKISVPRTACYGGRRPERTLLYRTLKCGILAHGFARARCGQCGHEFLIASSCQGGGVCPACPTGISSCHNARRMVETAAHLAAVLLRAARRRHPGRRFAHFPSGGGTAPVLERVHRLALRRRASATGFSVLLRPEGSTLGAPVRPSPWSAAATGCRAPDLRERQAVWPPAGRDGYSPEQELLACTRTT